MAAIRIGIGGWTFAPWRGTFYPPGLPHAQELAFASRQVTAIEINGTFYRHQTEASFAAWRDQAPEDFVFAVKAHRATTHGRDLTEAGPAIERFLGSGITALGPKLGPILWQFPHTRRYEEAALAGFLSHLPPNLRHAIEARHPSFAEAPATEQLRAAGVAQVIVDSDKQALSDAITADFVYARLQRNSSAAPEGYPEAALDAWAQQLQAWADRGLDVFAFFIAGEKENAPRAALACLRRAGALPLHPTGAERPRTP